MNSSFEKHSISRDLAQKILDCAVDRARNLGRPLSIAVVDESGILKAFTRMDGAPLVSVQLALDKAYTGASSGISSDMWFERLGKDKRLAAGAVGAIDRLVVIGGAYPIKVGETLVGGLGVSGGPYELDQEVATAALELVE